MLGYFPRWDLTVVAIKNTGVGMPPEAEDFIGCPYLNTAIETPDPANPVSELIRRYLAEVERHLRDLVAATDRPNASRLAKELQTLISGSIMLGVANRTTAHVLTARHVAVRLLGAPAS
jgi:hypothetical protein